MLSERIISRFSSKGRLRKLKTLTKKLCKQNPDSKFASEILRLVRNKFWFGSRKVTYSSIAYFAWQQFVSFQNDEVIKIRNLNFINDFALSVEYPEIFLADSFETFTEFKDDVLIAAKVLACLSKDGPYQSEKVAIQPGDVVIDAGANMGIFSLFAIPKAKKIFAFEPQKRAIDILLRNIALNNANNAIS